MKIKEEKKPIKAKEMKETKKSLGMLDKVKTNNNNDKNK